MALGFVSPSVTAWISTRACDLSLIRVAHLSASSLYQIFSDKPTEEEQLALQAVHNGGWD